LARIELTEEEKKTLLKEVDPILNYVAQLKEVSSKMEAGLPKVGEHRNVMRTDEEENESGANTDALVAEFPEKQGNYLKVKKIL
jgi:aspartyl/glutamyl-tRNA(Asn/Gln) amidotransferase C subunit